MNQTTHKQIATSINSYIESKDKVHILEMEGYLKSFFSVFEVKIWSYDANVDTLFCLDNDISETVSLESSLTQQAIISKEVVVENHITSNKYYQESIDNPFAYKVKGVLIYPIVNGKNVIGVIRLWRGLRQRKNFIKQDEAYLASFAPLFIALLEMKSLSISDFLQGLGEKENNTTVNKKNTSVSPRSKLSSVSQEKNKQDDVEGIKNTLKEMTKKFEYLQKENDEMIEQRNQALKDLEKEKLEKHKVVENLQTELDALGKKYVSLEASSLELYNESQFYQEKIHILEDENTALHSENKLLKKEMKKLKKQTTDPIENRKSKKSSVSLVEEIKVQKHLESWIQIADIYFGNNEYAYMVFELLIYATSSTKGIEFLDESIRKTKLLPELLEGYYFMRDLQLYQEKYRIESFRSHIKKYEKDMFLNMVKFDITIHKNVPASLVLDASKIQSVLLHLLVDLYKFVDHSQKVHIDFNFKNKFLSIEIGGSIHRKKTLLTSMFKQNILGGNEKEKLGLQFSKKLVTRLKGELSYQYENDYYRYLVRIPSQIIKL